MVYKITLNLPSTSPVTTEQLDSLVEDPLIRQIYPHFLTGAMMTVEDGLGPLTRVMIESVLLIWMEYCEVKISAAY